MASSSSATATATAFTKDLSLVPEITFAFVEEFIKSHSTSSGKEQMTKGFKYHSEQYVHSVSGKFSYVNNSWTNEGLFFGNSAHVKTDVIYDNVQF